MGLWVRKGRRRWERIRGLPIYRPPVFLRLSPSPREPAWRLSWTTGPDFGADALPELLDALLQAASVPPGGPGLRRISGSHWEPVEGISPFSPQAVRPPGLRLQKVEVDPPRWLLTLSLAQSKGGLFVLHEEKYLGGWWASLLALKRACQGEGGPPAGPC
jgi:hypothetical protein